MSTGLTTYSSTDVLDAATMRQHIADIETWVNDGMEVGDIYAANPWIRAQHIQRQVGFGAPAPRVEGVSRDVHYRCQPSNDVGKASMHHNVGSEDDWHAVWGLGKTFKSPRTQYATIEASFFAFDFGGANVTEDNAESASLLVATFGLFVNGSRLAGTRRTLYATINGAPAGFKQISMVGYATLGVGVNHIHIGIQPVISGGTSSDGKHIFVLSRSISTDADVL